MDHIISAIIIRIIVVGGNAIVVIVVCVIGDSIVVNLKFRSADVVQYIVFEGTISQALIIEKIRMSGSTTRASSHITARGAVDWTFNAFHALYLCKGVGRAYVQACPIECEVLNFTFDTVLALIAALAHR